LFVGIDETDNEILEPCLAASDLLIGVEHEVERERKLSERSAHLVEAFLDTLRDADFAFACQELDRAHLTHVHAHGVRRAAEFRVDGRKRRSRFLGRMYMRE